MAKQTEVKKQDKKETETTTTTEPKDLQNETLDDDVDAILDEIDSVLEENAEAFVQNYIQKGGE